MSTLRRVRTVAQIAQALDVLVDHGFVTRWQRIAGRYWIETGGTDGPYSRRQASAWIDGATAMGADEHRAGSVWFWRSDEA